MKINTKVKIHSIGGEHIAIRQEGGADDMTRVVGLNATALELYNHLAGRDFELVDAMHYLVEQFDVAPDVALHDAAQWVKQMRDEQIIVD